MAPFCRNLNVLPQNSIKHTWKEKQKIRNKIKFIKTPLLQSSKNKIKDTLKVIVHLVIESYGNQTVMNPVKNLNKSVDWFPFRLVLMFTKNCIIGI